MKKKPRLRPTDYFIDACKGTNLVYNQKRNRKEITVKCSCDGIDQLRQFIITLTTKENTCKIKYRQKYRRSASFKMYQTKLKICPLYIPCTFVFFFSTNLDLGHCLTIHITNFKLCSFTANTVAVIKHSKVQKWLFYKELYRAHINMKYDIRIKSNQQQHKLIKDIASLLQAIVKIFAEMTHDDVQL